MQHHALYIAETPFFADTTPPSGEIVALHGQPHYRIANVDRMPPFLMNLASSSDHWLFPASNGGITAGRIDPDNALFPYTTDDRIYDGAWNTGSRTVVRVHESGRTLLWEPLYGGAPRLYHTERNLYKSLYGNRVVFEEINKDIGLTFRYSWEVSERFGFVRKAELSNHRREPVLVELLDGLQNLLPSGLSRRFQNEFSSLADAYKESELQLPTSLALYRLSSVPTDKAQPNEALTATTVWSSGIDPRIVSLSEDRIASFRTGETDRAQEFVRGRRGAYLIEAEQELAGEDILSWYIVADVGKETSQVVELLSFLRTAEYPKENVEEDIAAGTAALIRTVASSDGLQCTGDAMSVWRHFSNTLFNVMRGGLPESGYEIDSTWLTDYIRRTSPTVARRRAEFFERLPALSGYRELLSLARAQEDPDLERLLHEYLPFSFSRRHGDPSRPWNNFSIRLKDENGNRVLDYQGNWRDIFQNWEALSLSFPEFIEGMIFKFLDSSTADGYNPYRVTLDGFDWEIPNENEPWAHIGYWGDHQVVYLVRLMEHSQRYHPGRLRELVDRPIFTYANVPYRIRAYEEILNDPRNTIDFDWELHQEISKRTATIGNDAKLLHDERGDLRRATLAEKLLVTILSKLSNFVPEAGIWMNTQRPEWNDANNALVGYGASVVTVAYLRRFLVFFGRLLGEERSQPLRIAGPVADLLRSVNTVFEAHRPALAGPFGDGRRKECLDRLGRAGERYRQAVYSGKHSASFENIPVGEIRELLANAMRYVDHTLAANRREDGLFHSYNLLTIGDTGVAVGHLAEMLEGQVAILSSGFLDLPGAVTLLDALSTSALYREDQGSFLLYPDRQLPRFLGKNTIPKERVEASALLSKMLEAGDSRIIIEDCEGGYHFRSALRNGDALEEALASVRRDGRYTELVTAETSTLRLLYEEVFRHRSFTGRSGTFYKYEGLGSIYWHMVSKLLLAVQELQIESFVQSDVPDLIRSRLRRHYESIRAGIGVHKSPKRYGAIPTDPYSHTPSFSGAQQPGMTGQVKEDLISRLAELGTVVENGRVRFVSELYRDEDFFREPASYRYFDVEGTPNTIELAAHSLAFTMCQVPIVVHAEGGPSLAITDRSGGVVKRELLELDEDTSDTIFRRSGEVRQIEVFLSKANKTGGEHL